ncbi:hypothetical protein D3C71_1585910 [compost metagenome]
MRYAAVQDGTRLWIEIPQQAEAQAVVGKCSQLLLALLERLPQVSASTQCIMEVDALQIQAHREDAGEPAYCAREIQSVKNLLAAVAFQMKEDAVGTACGIAALAPIGDGQCKGCQQHIIDAAVKERRYVC